MNAAPYYDPSIPPAHIAAHALQDTVLHFGNDPKGRRLPGKLVNGSNTKACAIGRFMDTEQMLLDGVSLSAGSSEILGRLKGYLHPSFQSLPHSVAKPLVDGLISLHDNDANWGTKGLTSVGKACVRNLLERIPNAKQAAGFIGFTV